MQQDSLQQITGPVLMRIAELPINHFVVLDDYAAAKPDGLTYAVYFRLGQERRQVGYWGFGPDSTIFVELFSEDEQ